MNLFDCIAPVYGSSLRLRQASRHEIVSFLGVVPDDLVVDIGGGSGIGAHSAVRVSGCRAVVVDRSPGMLKQVTASGHISVAVGDATALPFADASVDGALCLDALHHFRDAVAALREIKRVLRPGSCLVVQELDRRGLDVRIISLAERMFGEPGTFWTPEELKALFLTAGLSSTTVEGRGGVYYAVGMRKA